MPEFHEIRLPDDICLEFSPAPTFSTAVVTSAAGFEQRNINWKYDRSTYVCQYIKEIANYYALQSFFRARSGKAHGFRFKDWSDYQADSNTGQIRNVNGVLRCTKIYSDGSYTFIRPITKVCSVGNGGSVNPTLPVGYTLELNTGIITGTPIADDAYLTWTGEFDVPVRFDTDSFDAKQVPSAAGSIIELTNVKLIEVRV